MIEITRLDNQEALDFRLKSIPGAGRKFNEETARKAVIAAGSAIRKAIPKEERATAGGEFGAISPARGYKGSRNQKANIPQLQDRIRHQMPKMVRGGAGGGVTWKARAYIGLLGSEKKDPATFYFRGSGIHGPNHTRIRSLRPMASLGPGGQFFMSSQGQKPHREPMIRGKAAARRVVSLRISNFRANGLR